MESEASNLVPGDTNGDRDLFVKDLATGTVQRISTDSNGGQADQNSLRGQWSPDGARIMFSSWASNLIPADTNGASDVFVKTLASGALQRVSTNASGSQANGDSSESDWSPDGSKILIISDASNLVPGDTNGAGDLFEKNLASGATRRVSTDASGNQADGQTHSGSWSPDGSKILINSDASNLVPGDTNNATDVFVKSSGE